MDDDAAGAAGGLPEAAVAALRMGNKIEAIKIVRHQRRMELKDAKDAVEAHLRSQPALQLQFEAAGAGSRRSAWVWLAMLAAFCALVYLVAFRP